MMKSWKSWNNHLIGDIIIIFVAYVF